VNRWCTMTFWTRVSFKVNYCVCYSWTVSPLKLKSPVRNLSRQHCAERFNSRVKGLRRSGVIKLYQLSTYKSIKCYRLKLWSLSWFGFCWLIQWCTLSAMKGQHQSSLRFKADKKSTKTKLRMS
jgi:hypothetical protein